MVGVTKPEFFLKLRDGGADEGLAVKWTCHERTEQGDVALLYRTEISDIAHLFLIDSHNHELWEDSNTLTPGHGAWHCDATLAYSLRSPIQLAALREDQRLRAWAARGQLPPPGVRGAARRMEGRARTGESPRPNRATPIRSLLSR